jgi:hypothetical protein
MLFLSHNRICKTEPDRKTAAVKLCAAPARIGAGLSGV